jgi:hypothetical protein
MMTGAVLEYNAYPSIDSSRSPRSFSAPAFMESDIANHFLSAFGGLPFITGSACVLSVLEGSNKWAH